MTAYELFQLNKYGNILGAEPEEENDEAEKFAEWAYHQEEQLLIELENQ